jgi:hypothetical protein
VIVAEKDGGLHVEKKVNVENRNGEKGKLRTISELRLEETNPFQSSKLCSLCRDEESCRS